MLLSLGSRATEEEAFKLIFYVNHLFIIAHTKINFNNSIINDFLKLMINFQEVT